MGIREEKKQRTHDLLVTTALRLFTTRGYEETTMEDIATAAGTGTTTLYRYFSSKEELAVAPMRADLDRVVTALRDRPTTEPAAEALRAILAWMFTEYQRERMSTRPVRDLLDRNPGPRARVFDVQARWRRSMAQEIAIRMPEPDRYGMAPMLIAVVIGAVTELILDIWVPGIGTPDTRSAADEALRLLRDGSLPLPDSTR